MNEREAIDAIRALCETWEEELSDEGPWGEGYERGSWRAAQDVRAVLDRVESSPPPAIDRDALVDELREVARDAIDRYEIPTSYPPVDFEGVADRILALVRPVAGVSLTPEEAHDAATCVRMVIEGAVSDRRTEAHLGALAARLEAGDA